MTRTSSRRARVIRTLLQLRKAATDWNAPVEALRSQAARADRFIPLPAGVVFERKMADAVPVELILPPAPCA